MENKNNCIEFANVRNNFYEGARITGERFPVGFLLFQASRRFTITKIIPSHASENISEFYDWIGNAQIF